MVGVIDLLLPLFVQCPSSALLKFIRALRCFRVLRIIASFKQAGLVINAATVSFNQLSNVCILLVLMMFVMASLGMALFQAERHELFKDGVNLYANLESTYGAMQLMFVVSTGTYGRGNFGLHIVPCSPACLRTPPS